MENKNVQSETVSMVDKEVQSDLNSQAISNDVKQEPNAELSTQEAVDLEILFSSIFI